ncbi:MAG: lamin tail domain-containing protein [Verrucomicrobiales bacterium]
MAAFQGAHPGVTNVVGPWVGKLSNGGENVRLVDAAGDTVDAVHYYDEGEWARRVRGVLDQGSRGWDWVSLADGGGRSLELRNPEQTNNEGQNWGESAADGGTPGAQNSLHSTNIAPLIRDVKHSPAVPRPNETVKVSARVTDDNGSASTAATLYWRLSRSGAQDAFTPVAMAAEAGSDEFEAQIPGFANGTVIEFYVQATDGANARTWPAPTDEGQSANCLFQFDAEAYAGPHCIYRLIMSLPEDQEFTNINRQSDALMNTTFIGNDGSGFSIRYLCGTRIRGESSRGDTPPPMRVNLPGDNPWNGLTRMNLNSQFTWLQFIGMKFFTASNLAAPQTRSVAVRRNGVNRNTGAQEDYGLFVHVDPLNDEFLAEAFPGRDSGNIYKKTRPDNSWAYRAGNVNTYINDGWNKQTNGSEWDWSDLDGFLNIWDDARNGNMNLAEIEAIADIDQWMRWFGVMTLLNNGETNASNGTDDDYSLYRPEGETKFIFLPHDLDTILGQGDGSAISDPDHTIFDMIENGDVLEPLVPFFNDPSIRTRYHQALRDLLQTSFSKRRFDDLMHHSLDGWVPEATIANMIAYMDQRRAHVTDLVDTALGPPPAPTAPANLSTLTSAPAGSVMISEIVAHPSAGADQIELFNSGGSAADIGGWTISDDAATPARYVFPGGTQVPAGGYLLINADAGTGAGLHTGFGIDADGDQLYLYNGSSALVDSVEFGPQPSGYSLGRTGATRNVWALCNPSPGSANAAVSAFGSPADLRVNEWLGSSSVLFKNDFVEIYNGSGDPVAVGGMAVTDDSMNYPDKFALPPLSFIAPEGYLVLRAVGEALPDKPSEMPFKLNAHGDWITLIAENGIEIDRIAFVCGQSDVSQGRSPDGEASFGSYTLPTPGLPNPVTGVIVTEIVPWSAQWRFNADNTDLGTAWQQPAFNDSGWTPGTAPLGVETSAIPIPLATPLPLNPPRTHYFRHTFNFTGDPSGLMLEFEVDDGMQLFLNGQDIRQFNMPGTPAFNGTTPNSIDNAGLTGPEAMATGALVQGQNVLAAMVLQSSNSSSDIVFAARVTQQSTQSGDPEYEAAKTLLASLRITEIMYNQPTDPDQLLEFIEFKNVGGEAIDLGGIRLSNGVSFVFPAMTLDPGEYTVVAADETAFRGKYGSAPSLAGVFTGKLSNGGETIQVQLPEPYEASILCFAYNDSWYPETDGGGYSLTIADPLADASAWDKKSAWVPSQDVDGTPGSAGPPIITSNLQLDGIQGEPINYQITAANDPTAFSASGLPAGLTVDANGLIGGTPTVVATTNATITASNVAGEDNRTLVITIAPQPPPSITSALNASGLVNNPFTYQIAATNNPTAFGASGLPGWLGINTSTGVLSGTAPAGGGTFNVTISAENLSGSDSRTLTINIISDPLASAMDVQGLIFTTGGDEDWEPVTDPTHDGVDAASVGEIGNNNNAWMEATVTGPDTLRFWWMLTNGPGPDGNDLRFELDGSEQFRVSSGGFGGGSVAWEERVVAIPAGTHTVRWRLDTRSFGGAQGGRAAVDEMRLDSAAQPVITSAASVSGVIDQPFSYQITATNSPTTYAASGLPPWLSINPVSGMITGTPEATGSFPITVEASNASGFGEANISITITPPVNVAEAVDQPGLTFAFDGVAPWFLQTGVTHDGTDAAQSGAITHGQSTGFSTTLTGPGRVEWYWKSSAETPNDLLSFHTNDTLRFAISGETDWQFRFVNLPAGQTTVRWQYAKNESVDFGDDTAWVDEIAILGYAGFVARYPALTDVGTDDDQDGDGLTNIVEFALGTDPTVPNSANLPDPAIENGRMVLTLTKPADTRGLTYAAEFAETPAGPWTTNGVTILTNDATTFKVQVDEPVAQAGRGFIRLRFTLQ